eukprot:scaffold43039_cov106-Phaeocystis_antarctica.AAC.3
MSSMSCTKRHDSRPDRPPLILVQREDGGYGYMANERERAGVHQWYVQHPRQRWRHGHVAPLQLRLLSA